jgi:predicted AlkP superfamily phosphohydrolase/phosphomutase
MRLILKANRHSRRMLVISLDGYPFSLFQKQRSAGVWKQLGTAMPTASSSVMESVVPTVSSVAWSTFMSGRNPGNHNIYGFIDRILPDMSLTLLNASSRRGPSLQNTLNQNNIPVIMMNVPVTWPPEPVNSILVGGFLGVDPEKIAYPPSVSAYLTQNGYIIDANTSEAADKPFDFIDHLTDIVRRRCDAFKHLLESYPWEYAHLHIMETDRLFHFLWKSVFESESRLHSRIWHFFEILDSELFSVINSVNDSDEIILLSDHGFSESVIEWDINAWLLETGRLKWMSGDQKGLRRISPDSIAYSLIPGRIYLNLRGREMNGVVDADQANQILANLKDELFLETQPDGFTPVFTDIRFGTDLFRGDCASSGPDLVAVPADGVELKSRLNTSPLVQPSRMEGMHTFNDAMVVFRHGRFVSKKPKIIDMYSTILSFFGICDTDAEGTVIASWPYSSGV